MLTIEPIVSAGSEWTRTAPDGWEIRSADGSLTAHHEHTIVIRKDRPLVLTAA